MHAITPRLFSKDVYSVPLRALRLRVCVRLDRGGRGGERVVTKMFPDVQKIFRTYNNFSKNTVVFQNIHFLIQNYLNSSENLMQIYLNLPKSALEIYLKFLTSNYQGCCTPPPTPQWVSSKHSLIYCSCISPPKILCITL
jgi:hypothetical protein